MYDIDFNILPLPFGLNSLDSKSSINRALKNSWNIIVN